MKARAHPLPTSFQNLFEYESFLTILRYYLDLNCFVVPPDPGGGGWGWLAVHYHRRAASLFDFEKEYGFKFNWSKLTDPDFEKSHPKGRPLLLETLGFYDIFTPIRRKGKRLGTVFSGAFADREPTYAHLAAGWSRLTGQSASAENPKFRQFVRVMLETPVLEAEALSAYRESLELFARALAGERDSRSSHRLRELLTRVFSKHFPHSYFLDWALGLPTSQATPIWNPGVQEMDWVRTDIGITRLPTTAIAVVPIQASPKRRDPVEEMLRIYRFQRRSFRFAQDLGQTVGGRLENYGALFVTSADPSLGRPQRRRQVQETARRIHRFAVEQLGGPALVGVGETVAPGESLRESCRQAVLALHLRNGADKALVFFTPGRSGKSEGMAELSRLLMELKDRFEAAAFSNMEEAVDGFLKRALTLSLQNPEEIRWHLHYALLQMGEAVKGRLGWGPREIGRVDERMARSLEKAATTQEMVLFFKDALEELAGLARDRGGARGFTTMEKLRGHLEARFREPLNVSRLARMAGVSASTLSRRFKKANGVGLEAYLQNLRLEEARRLLKTGSLPVAQVARSCGFKSAAYFTRLFRKKMGAAPGEYRSRFQAV